MHPIRSLIWVSGYRGWKVFLSKLPLIIFSLSCQVYLDVDPRPGGEPQRPGPKLGPYHNGALPKRNVDLGRRCDDGEVSLLTSNEGSPEPPHVFTKWFSP